MSSFHFKHFIIHQENAPLKVGTDSMILGALCEFENPENLLDIGSGTGVLAFMCAQKYPLCKIKAIEPNSHAFAILNQNINVNVQFQNINIEKVSLNELNHKIKYDAIICNPPYFENSLKNESLDKQQARHNTSLTFEDLVLSTRTLLTKKGSAYFILPIESEQKFIELAESTLLAEEAPLHLNRKIKINSKKETPTRCVLVFSKTKKTLEIEEFTIRNEDNTYTEQYKIATSEFHSKSV